MMEYVFEKISYESVSAFIQQLKINVQLNWLLRYSHFNKLVISLSVAPTVTCERLLTNQEPVS